MNPIRWFKELRYIVRNYSSEVRRLRAAENEVARVKQVIIDHTEIAADIAYHPRGGSFVLVVGRYKNREYIQTFSIDDYELNFLVDQLVRMERSMLAKVTKMDAPPIFKAIFEKHRNHFNGY